MAAPPRVNAREQAGDRAGAAGPRPFCSEYFVLPLPALRAEAPRPADPASAVKHSRGWPLSFPSLPQAARGREADNQADSEAPSRRRKKTHRRQRLAPLRASGWRLTSSRPTCCWPCWPRE